MITEPVIGLAQHLIKGLIPAPHKHADSHQAFWSLNGPPILWNFDNHSPKMWYSKNPKKNRVKVSVAPALSSN